MITADEIRRYAEQYDCFYLYEEKVLLDRIGTLVREFPYTHFLYSLKANDNQAVTATILRHGFGADCASPAEVQRAEVYGVPKEEIHYCAPGKTDRCIRETLNRCILIADSVGEVERISRIAKEVGVKAMLGLRIDPDYNYDEENENAEPHKLGIEYAQVKEHLKDWMADPNLDLLGIHVHLHSQELDWARLDAYHDAVLNVADELIEEYDYPMSFVNVGSGIGIAYSRRDEPCDVEALGASLTEKWKEFRQRHPDVELMMETGRYITGKSGLYVTKVIDRKTSRGKNYIILAGTLNGFVRPVLSRIITQYAGEYCDRPAEPFFTKTDAYPLWCVSGDGRKIEERETVTMAGNLCTANDMIAEDINFRKLVPGDLVVVRNAGAYASVVSPMQFCALPRPAQIMIREDDQRALMEAKEKYAYTL